MTPKAPREPTADAEGYPPPRLQGAIRQERGKLVVLTIVAVIATLLFGFCCSGAWSPPLSIGTASIITMPVTLIGLPWWWLAFRSTYHTFRHDLERDLARYGKPSQLIDAIDAELRDTPDLWVRGYYFDVFIRKDFIALTPHWLVQLRPHRAAVMRLDDIVWVYKRVVPRRVWVRSTSYRIQLGCRLRDGSLLLVEWREDDLDELVEELIERRPGLLTGWRGEYFDVAARGPDALAKAHDERAAVHASISLDAGEAWLDESYARCEGPVQNVE